MADITVPNYPLLSGMRHPLNIARNGVRPSGWQVAETIVGGLNHCLGYCGKRAYSHCLTIGETFTPAATATDYATQRFHHRMSANADTLRIRMVLTPTDPSSIVNYTEPYLYWLVDVEGGATVYDSSAANRIHHDERLTNPTTATTLDDLTVVTKEYALTPGESYRFELHQFDGIRVLSITAYEVIRRFLDTTGDVVVDDTQFAPTGSINQAQNQDVIDSAQALYKYSGACHIGWSVPGTTALTMTGTTETNILDGTTTTNGWTTTNAGFYVDPYNRHPFEETLGGSPVYAVPFRLWAYAGAAGGGSGTLRLRYGTGASDFYTTSTLTISTAGWYVVTGSLNGSNTPLKLSVTALGSGAGTTVSVYGFGVYDYL